MRIRAVAVVLSAFVLLTACGGGAAPQSAPAGEPVGPAAPASGSADSGSGGSESDGEGSVDLEGSPQIEKIKQHGKLMVGLPSDDPALAVHDESGKHSGFDVEMARVLAEGMGLSPSQVSFRWLPPSLRLNAISSGSVDVQLGGFEPAEPKVEKVGPYVITGPPGDETERFIGFKPGDEAMGEQLRGVLDTSFADGSWQRAYDATLAKEGVPARSPR